MRAPVYTVYCHTCVSTGKKYVGQTKKTMAARWREHVCHALRETGGCVALGRAIRRWGRHCWTHEVLETLPSADAANRAETKWIAQLNTMAPNGYNLDVGGIEPRHPNVGEKIRQTRAAKPAEWRSEQKALLRKAHAEWLASSTPEERRAKARAAWEHISPEERSEMARKREAAKAPEVRAAVARRAGLASAAAKSRLKSAASLNFELSIGLVE